MCGLNTMLTITGMNRFVFWDQISVLPSEDIPEISDVLVVSVVGKALWVRPSSGHDEI